MSYLTTKVGVAVPLSLVIDDGNTAQYPRAEIYLPNGATPVDQVTLPHRNKGRYEQSWIPTLVGIYVVHYVTYTDIGHTNPSSTYSRELDQLFVTQSSQDDLLAILVRILGLTHENALIDQTEFDDCDQLISSRVRIYDSKANTDAAAIGGPGTTGLIATYQVLVTYEGPARMKTYKMVKLP
jgi:hypothetical protein